MLLSLAQTILVFCLLLVAFYAGKRYHLRKTLGAPPGPPASFGRGTLPLVDARNVYVKLADWAVEYGPIYTVRISGQDTIVLSSAPAVQAIMEKESSSTQGRPHRWLVDRYIYEHDRLAFTDDLAKVTTLRRAFRTVLSAQASLDYVPIQEAETCDMLFDLLYEPEKFQTSLRRLTFSSILAASYGVRAVSWQCRSAQTFTSCAKMLARLFWQGENLPPNYLGLLGLIPQYFAPWKADANRLREQEHSLLAELQNLVQRRMQRNTHNGCFMEKIIENQTTLGLTDHMLLLFGGSTLLAGGDTTASVLLSSVLLLLCNPDVQRKAALQLLQVVGEDRLPDLADIPNLPYIQAIAQEVDRMRPALPLGAAHRALTEQTHGGYRIPKDSTLLVNMWAIGHDTTVFEDPETFRPERWLEYHDEENQQRKPATWAFGVGRRICVGTEAAQNLIHLMLSRVLWAFEIVPVSDTESNWIPHCDLSAFAEGISLCPKEHPCAFRPRSGVRVGVLEREWRVASERLRVFETDLPEEEIAFAERRREDGQEFLRQTALQL